MEKEIWKTIENYPNYQISSMGRVKSLNYKRTGEERIMKQTIDKIGYCRVNLHKEGKNKLYLVHKLVALHFIPNPQNLPQVNHKSEVKTENCVENLEWVTQKQNCNYGTRNERMAKAHQKPILQLSKSGNIILRKWNSALQVERELNISSSNIAQCCKGKLNSAGKFKWMYIEDIQLLNTNLLIVTRLDKVLLKNAS